MFCDRRWSVPMREIVLDAETIGLDPKTERIVEIDALARVDKMSDDGVVVASTVK